MTPPAEQDPADRSLEFNLERLRLITANRNLGATWAMIGRADGGKPPKIAKRDYKRAARRAGQQWRLQHNRESQTPDATRTPGLHCSQCGNPATRECPCMHQLTCHRPLCDDCKCECCPAVVP